ncbi:MAG: alpha/beta hydrolase [Gemmatimonadaceae bacterium]
MPTCSIKPRHLVVPLLLAAALAACAKGDDVATTDSASAMVDTTGAPARAPAGDMSPASPDDEMKAVLDQFAALGPKPIETLTPAEARKQPTPADAVKALLGKQGKPTAPEAVGSVVNRSIAGPGGQIPIRIYTPKGDGPFPVVFYIHGGGWVIANLDVYDASPRAIANAANAVVVSTHYRQGPEHKFPAAHDDVYAAYKWVVANAGSLKGDTSRIGIVGESAGGNMAAATAMQARDKGDKLPAHMVLIYPVASADTATPSKRAYVAAKPLSTPMMAWFGKHYFKTPADAMDPRINLVAADLKGLPSATIIRAQIDPLLSEGEQLADRLRAAGVDVNDKTYEGAAHEFFGMGAVDEDAKDAVKMAADGLKKGFDRVGKAP